MQIAEWVSISNFVGEGNSELGDQRRTARLKRVTAAIATTPSASFPTTFGDGSELEGFYRLVESSKVDWNDLLSGHRQRTVERSIESDRLLVIHDTTEVRFPLRDPDLRRTHLGRLSTSTQGFYGHASLAVADEGHAVPLGTLRFQPFIHGDKEAPDVETKAFWEAQGGIMENERQRWFTAIEETEHLLASPTCSPIHVMDREADSYPMLAWLQDCNYGFVLRACHLNRLVQGESKALDDVLNDVPFSAKAEVWLGTRSPLGRSAKKAHPPRKRRRTKLHFRSGKVTFRRGREESFSPIPLKELPKTLTVDVVEVVELAPPEGEKPVRWLLLTSEPIDTPEQIVAVVATYQKRWIIEEFFKSLKSECNLQGRQMASASAILNVLAVLLPQAWRVLLLRSLSDESPDEPWHAVLEPLAFELLRHEVPRAKLNNASTVEEAMLAVAALGGHLRRNGRPGWAILHRGWRKLADLTHGAQLALLLQQRRQLSRPND